MVHNEGFWPLLSKNSINLRASSDSVLVTSPLTSRCSILSTDSFQILGRERRSRSRTQPQEPLLQEVGVLWGYLEDEIGLI